MIFNGELYFRCERCDFLISIPDALGYYPNPNEEITIICPYCGAEY
jgi:DNA-directed RNA polymerase subunit RPC12/RpoP